MKKLMITELSYFFYRAEDKGQWLYEGIYITGRDPQYQGSVCGKRTNIANVLLLAVA